MSPDAQAIVSAINTLVYVVAVGIVAMVIAMGLNAIRR